MREILKLADEDYFGDRDHVSKSWLDLLDKSPAHLNTYLECGYLKKDTEAFRVGKMIHKYVLERNDFFNVYAIEPDDVNRRTNIGKRALCDFALINKSKIIITQQEFEFCSDLMTVIASNRCARKLLIEAANNYEVAVRWVADNGVKCKAKADIFNPITKCVIDLKTFGNYKDFTDSIRSYRYDVQGAHYLDGFQADRFIIIGVSKKLDWCECLELDRSYLDAGLIKRNINLDQYKSMNEGRWPGCDIPTVLSNPDGYENDDVEFDL